MARDFENIYDPGELSDEELRAIVREELGNHDAVDSDSIVVGAEDGVVRLSGRVGTEAERRIAERVLTDVIGVREYRNELVVDAIHRDEEPEAIDDHLADGTSGTGAPIGQGVDDEYGPEAGEPRDDLQADTFGTTDPQRATHQGTAWIPPESPTSEGVAGTEPDSDTAREDH